MTPAAIRAAEGPALDAFVLERVCGFEHREYGWRAPDRRWWPGQPYALSTSDAACWRWVVPALVAKGCRIEVIHDDDDRASQRWICKIKRPDQFVSVIATAPTPALAIVRAAALTVAEGGE